MKKTALFLYLALGLLSCCKDKGPGFDQSTVLQVKTQYILGESPNAEGKAFVFLSNAENKVIGSAEISNNGTFDIKNDIPYDGGAFDVHYVRASRLENRFDWSFFIESYAQVQTQKIYLKGTLFGEPSNGFGGKVNFHIAVSDFDYYNIQGLYDYKFCSDSTVQSCETDFSLSLRYNGDGVLLSFFNESQNKWRYGLLTSLEAGDDITISDADLPFETAPIPLDFDTDHSTGFGLFGFLEDHYNSRDNYRLGIVQYQATPALTHLYAPVEVLSKFDTEISLHYPDLNESYYFNAFGPPVFSYHPQPADFSASLNGETISLTSPGSGISYYSKTVFKKGTGYEEITWEICSDLSQPFTIPEMPKELEKLMSNELKQAKFDFGSSLSSIKDSRYATYEDYLNAVLISEEPVTRDVDYTSELKSKGFE